MASPTCHVESRTAQPSRALLPRFWGRRCRRRMRGWLLVQGLQLSDSFEGRGSCRKHTAAQELPPHPPVGTFSPAEKRGGEGLSIGGQRETSNVYGRCVRKVFRLPAGDSSPRFTPPGFRRFGMTGGHHPHQIPKPLQIVIRFCRPQRSLG